MEVRPTPTKDDSSTDNTMPRQEFQKTSSMSGHRKSKTYQISKPTFWNTQKRLVRRQTNRRSIDPKQMYPMSILQNVNHETGPAASSKTFLDYSAGPQGWILAYNDSQEEKRLSRVLLQRPNVALSRPSIWSQYRSKDFYKINSFYSQGSSIERRLGTPVPRRPFGYQCDTRGMLTSCQNSDISSDIFRLDLKRKEISTRTSSNLRLARSKIRPRKSYGTGNRRENRLPRNQATFTDNIKILHKKANHENSGPSELHRPVRPINTGINVKNKSTITLLQKSASRCKDTHDKRDETQPHQMGNFTEDIATTRKPNAQHHNPNRRVIKRLGISDQSKTLPRRLRSNSRLFDQHTRTTNSVVCTNSGDREKCGDSSSLRQLNNSKRSQKVYIGGIPPSNDFGNHLETSDITGLETNDFPYRGTLQCSGRSIVQEHHPINRVVVTPKGLSKIHTQREQVPSSRSLRNKPESSAREVHFPLSRSKGNSSRCNDSQLGQMETSISVPTSQHDFQGFVEADRDKVRLGGATDSRDADTTMVHGTATEENTIDSDTGASSTTSVEQNDKSSHTNIASRVEVIKTAYYKRFPGCDAAIDLMARPLRQNSINDYQQKWESFRTFLNNNNIPFEQVTVSCVLQFFTFLFHQRHFKPGTVAHYKTALTVPLKEYFNIDLKDAAFSELIRAMWLQRPNKPSTSPVWSLNKVLEFIDQLQEPLGEKLLLRKTAFLLLLATGWRVSELHACVRNNQFCRFSENSSLFIRPHPTFLAKNERPHRRWLHKEIKILKLADESISNLCPVTTLKQYLSITSDYTKGALLLTPGKHQTVLSKHQLSTHICSLILQADKVTAANVHDIRSYATSLAFEESMLVGDLVSAVNWSSPAVFYKFYHIQTEPTTRLVSLPVQRN